MAQHAPVGSGQNVVLQALALPPYVPPCELHAAGVDTEHEPELTMQHAPVGHEPLTHAEALPWYVPPTPPQSVRVAVKQPVPMQQAPGQD